MPRYFFNITDGSHIRDETGIELPDLTAVRREALRTSGEVLRDKGDEFWTGEPWEMRVSDENGREVLTLKFSASEISG